MEIQLKNRTLRRYLSTAKNVDLFTLYVYVLERVGEAVS